MKAYGLHEPRSIEDAVSILVEHGSNARPLAGGTDLVAGILRDHVAGKGMPLPEHLVDLATIPGLSGIQMEEDHVRIGAMTPLADVAESELLRGRLPLLVEAAGDVASPEIRSVGTVGGNIHQRPRCWFFRMKDFDCIKKGGDVCFALDGDNRYNAILDGHLCFIVHPSDLALALLALDATATVAGPRGERTVAFDDYFLLPAQDLLRETVLEPDELLTGVQVPLPAPTVGQAWLKVNEKGKPTWDFAVVSAAVTARVLDGVWESGRITIGGVAPVPYRATAIEQVLEGQDVLGSLQRAVAEIRRLARPMSGNAYKVDLAETVVARAVRMALERAGTEAGSCKLEGH